MIFPFQHSEICVLHYRTHPLVGHFAQIHTHTCTHTGATDLMRTHTKDAREKRSSHFSQLPPALLLGNVTPDAVSAVECEGLGRSAR